MDAFGIKAKTINREADIANIKNYIEEQIISEVMYDHFSVLITKWTYDLKEKRTWKHIEKFGLMFAVSDPAFFGIKGKPHCFQGGTSLDHVEVMAKGYMLAACCGEEPTGEHMWSIKSRDPFHVQFPEFFNHGKLVKSTKRFEIHWKNAGQWLPMGIAPFKTKLQAVGYLKDTGHEKDHKVVEV